MKKNVVQLLSLLLFLIMGYMVKAETTFAMDSEKLSFQNIETKGQENTNVTGAEGIIVTSNTEFMNALSQGESLITVSGIITLGDEADASGKMLPVMIPANTTVQGTEGSSLNFRCPLQLEGENVIFQNIELHFSSSTALGSVPHREIFLAGYNLTLDNVSTYLEGSGGSLGNIGGSEAELLPTVYAGGFEGKVVGDGASLKIINANEETVFQGIYLGHTTGEDSKVPYTGSAILEISPKTELRDGIYANENSSARINISETGNIKELKLFGNEQTVLTISQANVQNAAIDNVGSVVLKNNADFALISGSFRNISLTDNACLDLTAVENALVKGNFTGGTYDIENQINTKGILVLDKEGTLEIQGTVSGTTQFQTGSRNIPGTLYADTKYIMAEKSSETDFILSEKDIENGYGLIYEEDGWVTTADWLNFYVGSVEVISAPFTVDISKIKAKADGSIPDESIYCEIIWKDEDGYQIEKELIEEYGLCGFSYILGVRTEELNTTDADALAGVTWGNAVQLICGEKDTDKYYFEAYEGVKTGDYTFLIFAEEVTVTTLEEVQSVKDSAMAAFEINFYDSSISSEPVPDPEPAPTPEPTPTPDPIPEVHIHSYKMQITKEATCTQKGVKIYTCEKCKDSYTEEIPLKEHSYAEVIEKASQGKNGSIKTKCKYCDVIKSTKKIYAPKKIKLSCSSYTYNGKSKKPTVTVTDSKGKEINGKYYSLSYEDNKKVGTATVKIRFKGRYSGTMEKNFSILPKQTKISKVTGRTKGVTVKWKKQSTQTSGYQIQYSTSSKFSKKATKTVTIKSNKTTSKTISKLKAKKKYYVRIRTYKNVKINGKTMKVYSKWSDKKSVITKK